MKSPAFCFEMIESETKTPCFTQILHLIGRLDTESDSQYRFYSQKKQYRQNPTVLHREDSQAPLQGSEEIGKGFLHGGGAIQLNFLHNT